MGGHAKGEGTGFGPLLKELRERAGLSQSQLAERAKMNVFGVAKLEQGQRDPSWATVLALSAALGVTCQAFAGSIPVASETTEPLADKAEPKKPAPKGKPKK